MRVIRGLSSRRIKERPLAIALGNFDGVHLGHRQLISQCVRESQEQGWVSGVLTFEPHPLMVLSNEGKLKLLNTYEQKYRLLEALGIDYLYLLAFDRTLAGLSPADFVFTYLVEKLNVRKVYVGFNFTYGEKGSGTSLSLQEMGRDYGFDVRVLEPVIIGKEVVSSSLIREKYLTGSIREAASLLGYRPGIEGTVVTGEQRGRKIGFPTANVEVQDYILLPSYGVYAGYTKVKGEIFPAIVNVGIKPTFGGGKPTLEVHIFGEPGNLYGNRLCVELVSKIRPEMKFGGADKLKEQIALDVQEARRILSEERPLP